METGGSIPYPQGPTNNPYSEPNQSSSSYYNEIVPNFTLIMHPNIFKKYKTSRRHGHKWKLTP